VTKPLGWLTAQMQQSELRRHTPSGVIGSGSIRVSSPMRHGMIDTRLKTL
jgi:hypothetical protein